MDEIEAGKNVAPSFDGEKICNPINGMILKCVNMVMFQVSCNIVIHILTLLICILIISSASNKQSPVHISMMVSPISNI